MASGRVITNPLQNTIRLIVTKKRKSTNLTNYNHAHKMKKAKLTLITFTNYADFSHYLCKFTQKQPLTFP